MQRWIVVLYLIHESRERLAFSKKFKHKEASDEKGKKSSRKEVSRE